VCAHVARFFILEKRQTNQLIGGEKRDRKKGEEGEKFVVVVFVVYVYTC